MNSKVFLASSSAQRFRILRALGVDFEVIHPEIDETPYINETPGDYVCRLALEKAKTGVRMVNQSNSGCCVIGADTSVIVDDLILGKPQDCAHAAEMLTLLSNRKHEVLSAVSVVTKQGENNLMVRSVIEFFALTDNQINSYLDTGEYKGRAGAYAIQGAAAGFVKCLDGSLSSVIGLPARQACELLRKGGIQTAKVDVAIKQVEIEFQLTSSWNGLNYT